MGSTGSAGGVVVAPAAAVVAVVVFEEAVGVGSLRPSLDDRLLCVRTKIERKERVNEC